MAKLFELPLDGDLEHLLDEGNLRPQSRLRGSNVFAEPYDHADFFGLDLV